jgi:hypothetical protein
MLDLQRASHAAVETAAAVVWLLRDAASFTTGALLAAADCCA